MEKAKRAFVAAATAAAGLVGCGGGGDSGSDASAGDAPAASPTPTASASIAGRWIGSGGPRRVLETHTFPDGSVWSVYSEDSTLLHGGFIKANGTISGTTVSAAGRNFNMDGAAITSATFNAQVAPKQTITGTATGDRAMSFNGNYQAEFELTPSVGTISGAYQGATSSVGPVSATADTTLRIDAAGAVSGTMVSGCTFTGKLSPRTDGNAYNLDLSFSASCPQGALVVTGIGYYRSAEKVLRLAAANGNNTVGFLALMFRAQ
jgi:hypothetical protein